MKAAWFGKMPTHEAFLLHARHDADACGFLNTPQRKASAHCRIGAGVVSWGAGDSRSLTAGGFVY
jgi:hypothetical protein